MTRDEIRLVAFILLALVIGAVVQRVRTRPSPSAPGPTPATVQPTKAREKPPYVVKDSKSRSARSSDANR